MKKFADITQKMISVILLCCIVFLTFSCNKGSKEQVSKIIPQPNNEKIMRGKFVLTEKTTISINDKEHKFIAEALQKEVEKHLGDKLNIIDHKKRLKNNIEIKLDKDFEIDNKEAYKLKVSKENVKIYAGNLHGLFYGIQSFSQLIPNDTDSALSIPCINISDQPKVSLRGVLFDVSTHFFSIDYLKKIIDVLAYHKMNTLFLHLNDDSGWRIEIKRYPKLTEVGAWREDRRDEDWRMNHQQRKPYPKNKPYYGGFYTQEEIKDLIKYASERFVDIIPEIHFPGRQQALLSAYPELSCSGKSINVKSGLEWGLSDPMCLGNDSSLIFIENVLLEIFDMFPDQYVMMGAGESYPPDSWTECEKCQNKIKELGLKNEAELNEYSIMQLESFITSHSKKIIGTNIYSTFENKGKPVILNWKDEDDCVDIINNTDFQVVNMYRGKSFSNYQAFPDNEPKALMPVSLLFDVYRTKYIPDGIPEEKRSKVLGGIGSVWTYYIQTPEMFEYMVFPRLCALSESFWTYDENMKWENFFSKLSNHYINLDEFDLNYYIPAPEGAADDIIFNGEEKSIWLSVPVENAQIRYTLDDTEPTMESKLYTSPIKINKGLVLRTKTFLDNGKSSITNVARYAEEPIKEGIEDPVNLYPGLKYKYYEGDFRSVTDLSEENPVYTGVIESITLPENRIKDHFGVEYEGLIVIKEEGVFSFYLTCDDGGRLYVDDYLVIDNDGIHVSYPVLGRIGLLKGFHKIKFQYFDYVNIDSLVLDMNGPGFRRAEISKDYFFYQK